MYRSIEPAVLDGDVFTSVIPLGPPDQLLYGNLECGLTYYVRRCSKPRQRAALALAVKVGSLVEDEAGRGVAHILEHLAFNATEVCVSRLMTSSNCCLSGSSGSSGSSR